MYHWICFLMILVIQEIKSILFCKYRALPHTGFCLSLPLISQHSPTCHFPPFHPNKMQIAFDVQDTSVWTWNCYSQRWCAEAECRTNGQTVVINQYPLCLVLWMEMCPSKFLWWNPDPHCDGGEGFGRCLPKVIRVGPPWQNSCPCKKEAWSSVSVSLSVSLSAMWGHNKKTSASQDKGPHRNLTSWHLDLGLPRLQNCEKQMSQLSLSVCGILLSQTDTLRIPQS